MTKVKNGWKEKEMESLAFLTGMNMINLCGHMDTNPHFAIRFATTDDINTIGYLAQQIWPGTYGNILTEAQLQYMMHLIYSPESLENQMLEKDHSFLILEADEQPVGFASFSLIDPAGVFKLHKLYVLPEMQGNGFGKLMIDYVISFIQQKNAKALQLNVNRHNKAKTFYERLGFSVIREEDIDIGNGFYMNDYVMELSFV
jgi:ribosomal protein S18 acetylase RimI-like enzyme